MIFAVPFRSAESYPQDEECDSWYAIADYVFQVILFLVLFLEG